MTKHLLLILSCLSLSQVADACISVGPEAEISFQFEKDSGGDIKVKMNTIKGDAKEGLELKDDDHYLTAMILTGYLNSNKENLAHLGQRHHADWSAQLAQLAEKLDSPFYKGAWVHQMVRNSANKMSEEQASEQIDKQIADLRKISQEVIKQKNINSDQLERFRLATNDLNQILSYRIEKRTGQTLTAVDVKDMRIQDLPGAVTGIRYRGLGCSPGKIKEVGIVPSPGSSPSQEFSPNRRLNVNSPKTAI